MSGTDDIIAAIRDGTAKQAAKLEQLNKTIHRHIKALDANTAALDLNTTVVSQAISRGKEPTDDRES